LFPFRLDAGAKSGKKAVMQFDFSGDVTDSCHFNIRGGSVAAQPGKHDSPDVTVETPFSLWADIMTGKADGRQMFMEQKYKVSGDLALMLELLQPE
jgi:putative sterol carrier protein